MSRPIITRQGFRKATLVWLLTLVTAAWGGVVAGHEHFGIDHEHCHVCLLPQVADLAPESPAALLAPPPATPATVTAYDYRVPVATLYQSRAPPP